MRGVLPFLHVGGSSKPMQRTTVADGTRVAVRAPHWLIPRSGVVPRTTLGCVYVARGCGGGSRG